MEREGDGKLTSAALSRKNSTPPVHSIDISQVYPPGIGWLVNVAFIFRTFLFSGRVFRVEWSVYVFSGREGFVSTYSQSVEMPEK